jgi:hypothetical protein
MLINPAEEDDKRNVNVEANNGCGLSDGSDSSAEIESDSSWGGVDDDAALLAIMGGGSKGLTAEQREQLQAQAHSMAPYTFPHPALASRLSHAQLERYVHALAAGSHDSAVVNIMHWTRHGISSIQMLCVCGCFRYLGTLACCGLVKFLARGPQGLLCASL